VAVERLHKREAGSRRRRDRAADSRLRRREWRARLRGTEAGSQRVARGERGAAASSGRRRLCGLPICSSQFPGVFPFNFLEFFFFSVLASIGSVEPKNRTEQAKTELVGFSFCRTPIGSYFLKTEFRSNRTNQTDLSVKTECPV
jgi:hypothetical protein